MQSEQDLLLRSSFPMLHSKNYGMWKIRLRGLLDDLDLLDYVDGTFDSSWLSKTSDDEAIKKESRIT